MYTLLRTLYYATFGLLLSIVDISIVFAFFEFQYQIHTFLIFLVFLLYKNKRVEYLLFMFYMLYISELYSGLPFGFQSLYLLIPGLILFILFSYVFEKVGDFTQLSLSLLSPMLYTLFQFIFLHIYKYIIPIQIPIVSIFIYKSFIGTGYMLIMFIVYASVSTFIFKRR